MCLGVPVADELAGRAPEWTEIGWVGLLRIGWHRVQHGNNKYEGLEVLLLSNTHQIIHLMLNGTYRYILHRSCSASHGRKPDIKPIRRPFRQH